MPNVLVDQDNNLYVYIYLNDHLPAHVHVFVGPQKSKSSEYIKINIRNREGKPELVLVPPSISKRKIKEAFSLVQRNQKMLLKEWKSIHGNKGVGKSNNRRRT